MENLSDHTSLFSSISLEEMDGVKLLDRIDIKYLMPAVVLPVLLEMMLEKYRILEINGVRTNKYQTIYYDTERFLFYLHHHNGKPRRCKVREREYLDSGLSFFEIKCKLGNGHTLKHRIKKLSNKGNFRERRDQLLSEITALDYSDLHPMLNVFFDRMTFVDKEGTERVTIDTNLRYEGNKKVLSMKKIVIAEVKQGKSKQSPFTLFMDELHLRACGASKYCLGIAQLYETVKSNRFKPRLIQIKKLTHESH